MTAAQALGLNALLLAVLLGVQVLFRVRATSVGYALGSLDAQLPEGVLASRARRVVSNQIEAMALLTAAAILDPVASGLAWVVLFARLAYVPAALGGVPLLRSGTWLVGFGATVGLVVSALL